MKLDFQKQESLEKYYIWAGLQLDILPPFEKMVERDEKESFEYLEGYIDDFEDCETGEQVFEEIVNGDNTAEFEAGIIAGKKAAVYFLKEILGQ